MRIFPLCWVMDRVLESTFLVVYPKPQENPLLPALFSKRTADETIVFFFSVGIFLTSPLGLCSLALFLSMAIVIDKAAR